MRPTLHTATGTHRGKGSLVGADPNRKYRELGLLWLRATAAYELLDNPILSDAAWDKLTKTLLDNYAELDVYLRGAIPHNCLESSTGSGVNWSEGLALMAAKRVRKELNL